mmetsp:Transcript_45519/g.117699  ORF Transcript_45519/g.117699 Transcript_45519/m.117699 type:complete len:256 (+) Transcript_45519:54-821(+)|eukprot:CAMPEP_0195106512 /NCGR_PEP_ID=MMETSP0448-20130528/81009_1 /TAXON_ID=66468 /ORGANISM="Heterocapsa triquestra, Strain CCMP 448" /LENGTH=255 /DNA_ID=CAMNT_0040142783 /DNA_START=48 /DNA_END=815 /DNA_ORIENTATION=-
MAMHDYSGEVELIGVFISPWSIRAKWVLEEAGVPYVSTESPADEDALRKRLGLRPERRLTYPMMVLKDGQRLMDSLDIAKLAARSRPELFPQGKDVAGWIHKADSVANLARSQLAWVKEQDDLVLAYADSLPADEPMDARKLKAKARLGRIIRKYSLESHEQDSDDVYTILKDVQQRIGDSAFLFSQNLSYADICMALALTMFLHGGHKLLPTGPPVSLIGGSPFAKGVVRDFPRLIAWADALVTEHFPQQLQRK